MLLPSSLPSVYPSISLSPPPPPQFQLNGEAFSSNRRALLASVSLGDSPIEPKSLSCAIDVTPGDAGGGPLGSSALIEQVKRAGVQKEVRGTPPWRDNIGTHMVNVFVCLNDALICTHSYVNNRCRGRVCFRS